MESSPAEFNDGRYGTERSRRSANEIVDDMDIL